MRACTYDRLLASLIFLVVITASALTPMQSDTWWQLRAGQDMWTSSHVLLSDTYSHTAQGAFWPNHEWLSEVIYYGAYRFGGLPLVTLIAAAVIAAGWMITWSLAKGPVRARFALTALALMPASFHWEPRPHAFSLLFQMIALYLVIEGRRMWLPLLFLVWANCHGGVLTGFVVLVTALAVETMFEPRTWWRNGLVVLGSVAAATVTPLGFQFWTEIPKSLLRIRQYPLDEWRPPGFSDYRLLPFWIVAAILIVSAVRYRRILRDKQHVDAAMLCASAFVLLLPAASAIRNIGPFLMLAVPAILLMIGAAAAAGMPSRAPHRPSVNLGLMSLAVAAAIVAVSCSYWLQISHLRWTPLPSASLAALQQCPDNLYNRYDEGGYLIWFAPNRRVFLDGRQDPYEPGLVFDQIRAETTGDYRSLFSRYHIRCAYLPVESPVAARLLTAPWTTLYRDAKWIVLSDPSTSTAGPTASARLSAYSASRP